VEDYEAFVMGAIAPGSFLTGMAHKQPPAPMIITSVGSATA
jgi:hypothetical protein